VTTSDFAADSQVAAATDDSNQIRTITQSAGKFRTIPVADKFGSGNQLQTKVSDKGTSVFGRPSDLGEAVKKRILPATENPDGVPWRIRNGR
jgi:hypothetical protein